MTYSLDVEAMHPEQHVAAVVCVQSVRQVVQASGEALLVESSVDVDDVHLWRVTVLHHPHHHQQVVPHSFTHDTHLEVTMATGAE